MSLRPRRSPQTLAVLSALLGRPQEWHYGYELLRETGLKSGTLYPILARMAERGWLRAAEPRRAKAARVYRLTPRGHDVLEQLRHALDELYGEVGAHGSPPPPVGSATRGRRRSSRSAARTASH